LWTTNILPGRATVSDGADPEVSSIISILRRLGLGSTEVLADADPPTVSDSPLNASTNTRGISPPPICKHQQVILHE
jgi:Uncharacterized protein conserved in bacteria with the myosin-like domain